MTRSLLSFYLVLAVAVLIAGCGGGAETPASQPATAVPASPTEAPTTAPTAPPVATPTAAPAETPAPRAEVYFEWAAGGVRPADSDDVDPIVLDLMSREGILSGHGNEIGITIVYNPELITIEEIQGIFKSIGHPVEVVEK